MRRTWFTSGLYNAICDVCGFKRKSNQLIQRWDGLMVCSPTIKQGCWEIRHPQDLIKPIPDQQALPWTRPEGQDQFIGPDDYNTDYGCPVEAQLSQACYAQACCAIVCNVNGGLIP